MPLNEISVFISSFLRPGYLRACLDSVRMSLPECQVIVVDDSGSGMDLTPRAPMLNTQWAWLPFDSGLTAKRNRGVLLCETPYWYCGADDFDFATKGFKESLTKAADILDTHPEIDLVGGRVDGNPYESNLVFDAEKNVIREIRLVPDGSPYQRCDLVVNAFLARASTLRGVPWDEEVRPIGGEHGQFFWHMKKAGRVTVWLPGWSVDTFKLGTGADVQDPRYGRFRRRAFAAGHTIMLRKEGIKDWVGA
jgi:hypothetical protein